MTAPRGLFQVLDTYMFHAFLKARLSRRMDAFAQMDPHTVRGGQVCMLGSEGCAAPLGSVSGRMNDKSNQRSLTFRREGAGWRAWLLPCSSVSGGWGH